MAERPGVELTDSWSLPPAQLLHQPPVHLLLPCLLAGLNFPVKTCLLTSLKSLHPPGWTGGVFTSTFSINSTLVYKISDTPQNLWSQWAHPSLFSKLPWIYNSYHSSDTSMEFLSAEKGEVCHSDTNNLISILLSTLYHRIHKVSCTFLVPINLKSYGEHVPCRFKYLAFPPCVLIPYPFCFLLYENVQIFYST